MITLEVIERLQARADYLADVATRGGIAKDTADYRAACRAAVALSVAKDIFEAQDASFVGN
jgi:hypothetical protein